MESLIKQQLTMEKKKNGFKIHFQANNGAYFCNVKKPRYVTHDLEKVTCKNCRFSANYFCAKIMKTHKLKNKVK